MRDEIMNKSSASWVPSQATPANVPLLRVDPQNREAHVYIQKGKVYVYNIDAKAWSVFDVGGDTSVTPTGKQICAMEWDATNGNMKYAFTEAPFGTAGVARLDATQAEAEDSYSSSGTSDVNAEIWLRPIEARGGPKKILVELIRLYHKVTATQGAQTTTAYVSYDHGATFPKSNQVTLAPVSTGRFRPLTIALRKIRDSIMLRVLHSGNGGGATFNVSHVEADVQVIGPERAYENGTPGSANL
jgi:hypothetical protein